MAQQGKLTSILEIASAVLRWWGLVVAGGALGLAGSIAAYHFMPKTYEATTRILVTPSQIPAEFVRSVITENMSLRLRSLKEAVLSRPYLLQLVPEVFGPAANNTDIERLIQTLRRRLSVQVDRIDDRSGTGLFSLTFKDGQPERAAKVANMLAQLYIEENVRLRMKEAEDTAGTLKKLADELASQLSAREKQVADFRARHLYELNDHLPANLQLLATRRTELETAQREMDKAQDELTLLRARRAQVLQAGAAGAGGQGEQIDPRVTRLASLERELEILRARYTEAHPLVKAKVNEVADLRRTLGVDTGTAATIKTPNSPLDLQIEAQEREIDRLRVEQDRIRNDIANYQARVEATPRAEQELTQLMKGYDILSQQYQGYQKSYEQARGSFRIEESRKGEQFEVVDRAVPPALPASPKQQQIFLIGIVLGLGACVGPLVLLKLLRPTVDSEAGLRGLAPEIPVLAAVDQAHTPGVLRRLRWRWIANGAFSVCGMMALAFAALKFLKG